MIEYSIKEIAKKLELAESTIRFWRDKFEKFIPVKGKGRKRKYSEKSFEIFKLIAGLSKGGFQKNEIEKEIKNKSEIAVKTAETAETAGKAELRYVPENEETKILEMMEEIISKTIINPVFKELSKKIDNLEKIILENFNNIKKEKLKEIKPQLKQQKKQAKPQLKQQLKQSKLKKEKEQIKKDEILFEVEKLFNTNKERADELNKRNINYGNGGEWTIQRVKSNINHAKARLKKRNK